MLTLVAASFTPSLAASAAVGPGDEPVYLSVIQLTSWAGLSGDPLAIVSDDHGRDLRTVTGHFTNGRPARIEVYSGIDASRTDAQLAALVDKARSAPAGTGVATTVPLAPPKAGVVPVMSAKALTGETPTTVSVGWAPQVGASSYSAQIGDVYFPSSPTPFFSTIGLTPDTEYTVDLITHLAATTSTVGGDQVATPAQDVTTRLKVRTLPEPPAPKAGVAPDSSVSADASVSAAPTLSQTDFNYRTFIPYSFLDKSLHFTDESIEQACLDLKFGKEGTGHAHHYSFVGDNRASAPPSASKDYRTEMVVSYDWTAKAFKPLVRDVGQTTVWDRVTNKEVAHRFASTVNMTANVLAAGATYAAVELIHAANDPFCPHLATLGAIYYDVVVNMYSNGNVIVIGSAAKMPEHEGWARAVDASGQAGRWNRLFDSQAGTLGCLVLRPFADPCRVTLNSSVNVLALQYRAADYVYQDRIGFNNGQAQGGVGGINLRANLKPADGALSSAGDYPGLPMMRLLRPNNGDFVVQAIITEPMYLHFNDGRVFDTSTSNAGSGGSLSVTVHYPVGSSNIVGVVVSTWVSVLAVPPYNANTIPYSAAANSQLNASMAAVLNGGYLEFNYLGTHNVVPLSANVIGPS